MTERVNILFHISERDRLWL